MNPFLTNIRNFDGERLDAGTAEARIRMVPTFGRRECEAALAMPGLQKTVAAAVRKQVRFLDRSIGPQCLRTHGKESVEICGNATTAAQRLR